jgi:preprotein translocase subunit SecA
MLDSLKEESVGYLFNLQVQVVPAEAQAAQAGANGAATNGSAADGAEAGSGDGRPGRKQVRARMRPVAALPTQEAEAAKAATATATAAAPAALRAKGLTAPASRESTLTYSGPGESGGRNGKPAGSGKGSGASGASSGKTPGRNEPCPCGSGKKYKMCHGRPGAAG